MAVIKEDGTIVALANSYATVVEADAYHEAQGNTTWEGFEDEAKAAGLIRGTLMLESRFNGRWFGVKTNNNEDTAPQFLAWPRRATTDSATDPIEDLDGIEIGINSIPRVVQYACMEAAFMHASGYALITDRIGSEANSVKSQRVDVISREFFEPKADTDRFPMIDQLLKSVAQVGGVDLQMAITITEAEADSIAGTNATTRWVEGL